MEIVPRNLEEDTLVEFYEEELAIKNKEIEDLKEENKELIEYIDTLSRNNKDEIEAMFEKIIKKELDKKFD